MKDHGKAELETALDPKKPDLVRPVSAIGHDASGLQTRARY